jgi:hypothetical protein
MTQTEADPELAIKLAGTIAVRVVELTYVVDRTLPFQVTWEFAVKPVPVAVSVKAGPPATAVEGEMLVRFKPEAVIVNVCAGGEF